MQKRLFVISVDAMVTEDIDAMRALPNFRKLFVGGCEVAGGMTSIYPTVTYPIHVAMTTGCYAGKNCVVRFSSPGVSCLLPEVLPRQDGRKVRCCS